VGKWEEGICSAVRLPCCFLFVSLCLFILIFSLLANTTVPNLREVKENMTMGTTLVTNPSGGFLVRRKCSIFSIPKRKTDWSLLIFCMKLGCQVYVHYTFRPCGNIEFDILRSPIRLHVLGVKWDTVNLLYRWRNVWMCVMVKNSCKQFYLSLMITLTGGENHRAIKCVFVQLVKWSKNIWIKKK